MKLLETSNAQAVALSDLPQLSIPELRDELLQALGTPANRLLAFFAQPIDPKSSLFRLTAIVGDAAKHTFLIGSALCNDSYASYTPSLPMVDWFEREIAEQMGITPIGHPWLKPIRSHAPWYGSDAFKRTEIKPAVIDNFRLEGSVAHEVAVGPVHAGVIEPGHFRFQCMGEDVYHLEIALGYQHRDLERLLQGGPDVRTSAWLETLAGDTSIASSWAGSAVIEALAGYRPSEATLRMRAILLELERIANHTGDLGALAGDVAFLQTASFCGRIRGDLLNLTATITGNRFGRNAVIPGGSRVGMVPTTASDLLLRLRLARTDLEEALALMFDAPTVLDRLENTGCVPTEIARELGLTGLAARASGLPYDARADFPIPGILPYAQTPVPAFQESPAVGDVFARAKQRRLELNASFDWLERTLATIAEGNEPLEPATPTLPPLASQSLAIGVTEAWRGELVHIAITDNQGRFARYKVVDPSFRNWTGLAYALRGEQISNFPICNKSFNLSYCGTDL